MYWKIFLSPGWLSFIDVSTHSWGTYCEMLMRTHCRTQFLVVSINKIPALYKERQYPEWSYIITEIQKYIKPITQIWKLNNKKMIQIIWDKDVAPFDLCTLQFFWFMCIAVLFPFKSRRWYSSCWYLLLGEGLFTAMPSLQLLQLTEHGRSLLASRRY